MGGPVHRCKEAGEEVGLGWTPGAGQVSHHAMTRDVCTLSLLNSDEYYWMLTHQTSQHHGDQFQNALSSTAHTDMVLYVGTLA